MKDTKKILGKYISTFIFAGVIIGVITFLIEMKLLTDYGYDNPSLVMTLSVLIFILGTVLIHMIATEKSIGKAILTKRKKETLMKTTRVVLGTIALILMIVDFIIFANLSKSYIRDYNNTEIEALKASVASGDNKESDVEQVRIEGEKKINGVVYMCMGTKEITDILVYLAVAAYVEAKIRAVKEESEEKKEEIAE